MKGEICCAICGKLHEPHFAHFPEDFPDEFKLCCNCHRLANLLTIYELELIITHFQCSTLNADKIRRIYNLIKVV